MRWSPPREWLILTRWRSGTETWSIGKLSDLAGRTTHGHSRPSPQLIIRVSRGRYLYREPDRPMDVALLQEYLEPVEVYEKRPARRRRVGDQRQNVPESMRIAFVRGAAGRLPGLWFSTSRIISGLRWTTSWR